MIETRLLQYFLAVARYGNITRAAENLYISQAALSKAMIELEKQLGKPLFTRGKRSIALTQDGIFLRQRATEILSLLESTESAFAVDDESFNANLVIGTAETHAMEFLADILTRFHAQHPKITYSLISADADMIMEQIDKGVIELALLMAVNQDAKYDYIKINAIDTYGLIMRSDDPLASQDKINIDQLKTLDLIVPQRSFIGHQVLDSIGLDYALLHVVATYNLIGNTTYLVKSGLGYALCIDRLVNSADGSIVFKPIEPSMRLPLSIVSRKGFALSPAANALMDMIRKSVDQMPK